MCIRDSLMGDALNEIEAISNRGGEMVGVPTGFTELDKLTNCLLYTSDAADERSSVDLGGRRIIKKKKSEEVTGRDQAHKI